MRFVMICGALGFVALVVGAAWMDTGEVVVLHTLDRSGRTAETELWFVDLEGEVFVRAASEGSPWLARAREPRAAMLTRNGSTWAVRAVPVPEPEVRHRLSEAMAAKYGRLSRVLDWFRGASEPIPVRLEHARAAAG